MSVLGELKRRKMFQVAAVYLVVAWLTMQIIDVVFTPLRLPDWFPTVVIVLLAIGFPATLIIVWAFDASLFGRERESHSHLKDQSRARIVEVVVIILSVGAATGLIIRTDFGEQEAQLAPIESTSETSLLSNSVAVLPFANFSPDPDNAYFAAGIHDTILTELANIENINVISRTAMIRYADTSMSLAEIARELRVQLIMEGSVQYANDRVLVTAQFIDPETNAHIWSANYDRSLADIFAIQTEIATNIAVATKAELTPDELNGIQEHMTTSAEAYTLYLQAMALADWDFNPGDSTEDFHHLLDRAIELDPEFARAYATKAHVYANVEADIPLAFEYAEKAKSIDPRLGLAYAALAQSLWRRARDEEAIIAIRTAYRLSPNDPNIIDDYARYAAAIGLQDDAVKLSQQQASLDPGKASILGFILFWGGDIENALAAYRDAQKYQPENHDLYLEIALLEKLLGNHAAAVRAHNIARILWREDSLTAFDLANHAHKYRLLGDDEWSQKIIDRFSEKVSGDGSKGIDAALWARYYLAKGDNDNVLIQLEIAAEQLENGFRAPDVLVIAANMYREPRLEEPEFLDVRARLGYPPGGR